MCIAGWSYWGLCSHLPVDEDNRTSGVCKGLPFIPVDHLSLNEMTTEGIDEFGDELDRLAQNAEELDGTTEVPLTELFNPSFMRKYTEFDSIEDMFEQSEWTVENEQDLNAISDSQFDMYVRNHTQFSDSDEMTNVAGEEWIMSVMGSQ